MTPSELRLWSALSARKLGVQLRREVPLLRRYIVDFCAPSVRLVVEVDGECHAARRAADARRDGDLAAKGHAELASLERGPDRGLRVGEPRAVLTSKELEPSRGFRIGCATRR